MLPLFHHPWSVAPAAQSTLQAKLLLSPPIRNFLHVVSLQLKQLPKVALKQERTHQQAL